jgi:hypothetical protein
MENMLDDVILNNTTPNDATPGSATPNNATPLNDATPGNEAIPNSNDAILNDAYSNDASSLDSNIPPVFTHEPPCGSGASFGRFGSAAVNTSGHAKPSAAQKEELQNELDQRMDKAEEWLRLIYDKLHEFVAQAVEETGLDAEFYYHSLARSGLKRVKARAPSGWNGFLSEKAEEINAGMFSP